MVSIERLVREGRITVSPKKTESGHSYFDLTVPCTPEAVRWLRRMGEEQVIRWIHSHVALSRATEVVINPQGAVGVGLKVGSEDVARLQTNELRVAAVMSDGEWHRMIDLRAPGIGGSAADSRIRGLRRNHDIEFEVKTANQMRDSGYDIPDGQRGGTTYYRCLNPDVLIAYLSVNQGGVNGQTA